MNRLRRNQIGDSHWYQIRDNQDRWQYAPGVTTAIAAGIAIPFGVAATWAAERCATYTADRRRLLAELTWDETFQVVKIQAQQTTEAASLKGKTIHSYAEQLQTAGQAALAAEHAQWAPHLNHYVDLLDLWEIDVHASEVPVADPDQRWAGTTDLIARSAKIARWLRTNGAPHISDDDLGIIDLKTGNKVRDKDSVQVRAYAAATICHIEGVEQPMPPCRWAAVIHVDEDRAELQIVRPDRWDDLHQIWLRCLAQWQATDYKRGWLHEALATAEPD